MSKHSKQARIFNFKNPKHYKTIKELCRNLSESDPTFIWKEGKYVKKDKTYKNLILLADKTSTLHKRAMWLIHKDKENTLKYSLSTNKSNHRTKGGKKSKSKKE